MNNNLKQIEEVLKTGRKNVQLTIPLLKIGERFLNDLAQQQGFSKTKRNLPSGPRAAWVTPFGEMLLGETQKDTLHWHVFKPYIEELASKYKYEVSCYESFIESNRSRNLAVAFKRKNWLRRLFK